MLVDGRANRQSGAGRLLLGLLFGVARLLVAEGAGWRATFYTTGIEHSPTSATGTAWERTPWHATQRAAWEALRQAV